MDTPFETPTSPADRVDSMLRRGCDCISDQIACLEDKVIESPTKAVLIAAGAGYLARSLPLASMLALPLRLAAKVAPPLLLAVGAAKIFEAIRCSGSCGTAQEEEEPLLDLFPEQSAEDT